MPYTVHQMLGWNASELLFLILPGAKETIVNPLVGIVPLTLAAIALLATPTAARSRAVCGRRAGRGAVFAGALQPIPRGALRAGPRTGEGARADHGDGGCGCRDRRAGCVRRGRPAGRGRAGSARVCASWFGAVAAFLFVVSLYPPAILQGVSHGADRAGCDCGGGAHCSALLLWAWQRGLLKPRAFVAGLLDARADRDRQ